MENCKVRGQRQEICVGLNICDYQDVYAGHERIIKQAWYYTDLYAVPLGVSRMAKILFGGLNGCRRQGIIFADLFFETAFVIALFPLFLWPHAKNRNKS